MSLPSAVITLASLTVTWPDGTTALRGLDARFGPGRTGLVGSNGSGKSTLLRVLAGALPPGAAEVAGHASVAGRVGYLAQDLTSAVAEPVDRFVGIAGLRAARAAIEGGSLDQRHFDALDGRWDAEERLLADLDRLGLPHDVLDRRLGELSGGEVVRLGLARQLLDAPDVLLLDEPTNNLDTAARARVHDVVGSWGGNLVVVSHDRDLLERVERVGELHDGELTWYAGGWSSYVEQRDAQQEAAAAALDAARGELRRRERGRAEAEQLLAQRRRVARRTQATQNLPKILVNARKNCAEGSAASLRGTHGERVDDAREQVEEAEARVREDTSVRIDLPDTEVRRGTPVLETRDLVLRTGRAIDLVVTGPERIAVVGANGTGKTTLLHTVAGLVGARAGTVDVGVPLGLLRQRLDGLDPGATVVDGVRAQAPEAELQDVRAGLARFGFRGARADRAVGSLSGGERFRAELAALLLARPAPRLLLLDEPTNNLDLATYDALLGALAAYRGALLVVSHDQRFLDDLEIDRVVDLSAEAPGPEA
ncbi:ABC-F family ATP-binding cassette domain-containing protein [Nocardioides alkalitolerans]|uniref:ABC-F family ATP-binding cassette domain-containing protein n=1 Tax=Nocardioides alkalitolerans TaxID=281714 RepID=UPI0003F9F824|nr:ATP-binding cassette domain-containing protein [Nocardioides alkalitolerans]